MSEGEQEQVGSVGEEATKLLRALQGWAQDSGAEYAAAAAQAAAAATGSLHDLDDHVATGGEDCRYCPLCQAVSAVRGTSPEVRQHLASAASSLLKAASGLLATHVPEPSKGPREDAPVERIDLSDDADWEDD